MAKKINKGYYHEGADRTAVIQSIIEDHLGSHPSVKKSKKLTKKINKVQNLLSDVYIALALKM